MRLTTTILCELDFVFGIHHTNIVNPNQIHPIKSSNQLDILMDLEDQPQEEEEWCE
jgi:hypothetical protein